MYTVQLDNSYHIYTFLYRNDSHKQIFSLNEIRQYSIFLFLLFNDCKSTFEHHEYRLGFSTEVDFNCEQLRAL